MKSLVAASLAVLIGASSIWALTAAPASAYYYRGHYYRYHYHNRYWHYRHCYYGPYHCRYW